MKLRIQTRYSLIILALIVSVIVILAGALLIQFRISMNEVTRSSSELMVVDLLGQLKSKGETLALFLAESLPPLVLQYNIVAIFEVAQAALEQKDVVYVYVYDQEGKIIHDGTEEISLYGKVLDDEISKRALAAKKLFAEAIGKMIFIQVSENIIDIAAPIKIGDRLLGGVRVGLTSKEITGDIEKMKSQVENINRKGIRKNVLAAVLIGLGSSILGIILAVIVSRGLSRPIQSLTEHARRIGRGEYDAVISVKRNDEIGELANSFRVMAQDLQRTTVSKDYVDDIIQNMINTLIVVDPKGIIQRVNQATLDLLGYEENELIGRSAALIFAEGGFPLEVRGGDLSEKGSVRNLDMVYLTKDGEKIPVLFSGSVMYDKDGDIGGIVCVAQDITERVQAEESLSYERDLLNTLIDKSPDIIYFKDNEGQYIRVNESFLALFGFTDPTQVLGKTNFDLFSQEDAHFGQRLEREMIEAGKHLIGIERKEKLPNGREVWISTNISPFFDKKGRPIGTFGISRDITMLKRVEEQINASLSEKEILLKEIHHRVKNNLQIISSLLNLQADYVKEEGTLNMFMESRNRVRSMALIHEKLYQSQDLARIDFGEYIGNLSDYLFQSYGVNRETIALKINAKGVLLNIDTAIPCGLIINELVSNSLKHAFNAGVKGEICIDLASNPDHGLVLKVGDNGIGLPEGLDFRNTQSLGLQLVTTLVEQLEGTIDLDGYDGATFRVTFIEQNIDKLKNVEAGR